MAYLQNSSLHAAADSRQHQSPAVQAAMQRQFSDRHLQPRYARLMDSIEATPRTNFYEVAGRFMRAFLDLETQGLESIETGRPCEPAHQEEASQYGERVRQDTAFDSPIDMGAHGAQRSMSLLH